MQAFSRMLVFLLLAAVITAPLAAQGLRSDGPPHERPAGCHEDAGNVPAPAPTSHNCCQGAHDVAILPQSFSSSLHLSFQALAQAEYALHTAEMAAFRSSSNLTIVFGDPPVPPPLRV